MARHPRSRRPDILLRIAGAVALILGLTFLFNFVLPANSQTIAFAYLIAILLLAASLGLAEALAASLTATVCLNYFFLPPVRTFSIADTANWIALIAFLV